MCCIHISSNDVEYHSSLHFSDVDKWLIHYYSRHTCTLYSYIETLNLLSPYKQTPTYSHTHSLTHSHMLKRFCGGICLLLSFNLFFYDISCHIWCCCCCCFYICHCSFMQLKISYENFTHMLVSLLSKWKRKWITYALAECWMRMYIVRTV